MLLAVRCHTARRGQPGHVLAIDLAPDALRSTRRVPLQKRAAVEGLADAVDPPPTECHIERLCGRHGRDTGALFEDPQPHFSFAVVIEREPAFECHLGAEVLDSLFVWNDWRHSRTSSVRSVGAGYLRIVPHPEHRLLWRFRSPPHTQMIVLIP